MDAEVQIEGWTHAPPAREVMRWPGEIVQVLVDPPRQQGWIPLGAFLGFARVLRVEKIPWWQRGGACPRCETKHPRFRVHVQWESGHDEPQSGGVLCEACVHGLVVEGGEYFTFGGDALGEVDATITIDLTR